VQGTVSQQRVAMGNSEPVAKSRATEPPAFFADLAPDVKALMVSNVTSAGGLSVKEGVSPYALPPDMGGLSTYYPQDSNAVQKTVANAKSNVAKDKIDGANIQSSGRIYSDSDALPSMFDRFGADINDGVYRPGLNNGSFIKVDAVDAMRWARSYATKIKQTATTTSVEPSYPLGDDDSIVRSGGLIVRTYKSEALANGGLVTSYLTNKPVHVSGAMELSRAESMKSSPQLSLDFDKFAKTLEENGHTTSQHSCAKYVRWALEAGGANTSGHPIAASEWGSTLVNIGYKEINKNNYTPQKGDVYIIEKNDAHKYGHIAGYTGSQWISDFKQKSMVIYKDKVVYHLYRMTRD
jgi:CHAP domain